MPISTEARSALNILLLTFVIHVVSYGTPYWTSRNDGHAGLWKACTDGVCYERYNQWVIGFVKVSQTFMTLSLIFLFFSLFLHFLYIYHKDCDKDLRFIFTSFVLSALACFSTLMAAIIWVAGEHFGSSEIVHVAFVLSLASAIGSGISTILLFAEFRQTKETFSQPHHPYKRVPTTDTKLAPPPSLIDTMDV